MDSVTRVVIRDKPPLLDAAVLRRRASRLVLLAAGASLATQFYAAAQEATGSGAHVGAFADVTFILVSLLWLALGVLVFLQRGGQRAGALFLLSAACGSIFLSLATLYRHVNIVNSALFAAGLLLFPPFLFLFARAYRSGETWKWWDSLLFVPSIILTVPGTDDLYSQHTSLLWRFSMLLVALFLLGAIVQTALQLGRPLGPESAAGTRALLAGLIAGTVPGVVVFIYPLVSTGSLRVQTVWLSPIILLFLVSMSYAVLLFELSEADLILRRGVVYGSLTFVIAVAYGLLGILLSASRTTVSTPGGSVSFVLVTVAVGAAFTPVRRQARRLVDWLLYGRETDQWGLLEALSSRLALVMEPDELGQVLVDEVTQALHIRGAYLLRRREDSFYVSQRAISNSSPRRDTDSSPLQVWPGTPVEEALGEPPSALLLIHSRPLTSDRHSRTPAKYAIFDDARIALAIPLTTHGRLEAVLCLQPKLAHDAFDSDDLKLLAPVIRQASAAFDNALLFQRLRESLVQLRAAYVRIAHEQEAERARLARELHDGTAQEVANLITLGTVAERQLPADATQARETLLRLLTQAQEAYQGVRRASHALRPAMLDDFGLTATLERFVEQFSESTGIEVEFGPSDLGNVGQDVELALFRVAQECLENARKHSGARHISLVLSRNDGHISLRVTDDGRGMGAENASGIGLSGIRERIESVGGSIRVEGRPGAGVAVTADVPAGEQA